MIQMRKYKRKPTEPIEAIMWCGPPEQNESLTPKEALNAPTVNDLTIWGIKVEPTAEWGSNWTLLLWVEKSQNWCEVKVGDWIIKESDGTGFYPCEGETFQKSYEAL